MRQTFTLSSVKLLLGWGLICLCGWGCTPDIDGDRPRAGNLNVTRLAAVGDGYTAGYSNGGLTYDSQQKAFPLLVVKQLREIQYLPFSTPWVEENGSGYISLSKVEMPSCEQIEPRPILNLHQETFSWRTNIAEGGPYDNLGIPGMSVDKMDVGASLQENTYLHRVLTDTEAGSYVDLLYEHPADMFVFWMGLTDLLEYALSGGTEGSALTGTSRFGEQYSEMLSLLAQSNRETTLILLNLPNPINFPYFSAVPYQLPNETICNGASLPLYIETEGGNEVRIATQSDRILLGVADSIGYYGGNNHWGLQADTPIPDRWVLDATEIQKLREHLAAYNSLIYERALPGASNPSNKFVLVDLYQLFENITQGHTEDGVDVSMEYLSGGIFSIDGYSLTPRGNALIANATIQSINNNFGSSIPTLNITDFEGVIFP